MRRALAPLLLLATTSCGLTAGTAAPACGSTERVAVVAQSVPGAAYVPCVAELPPGWRVTDVAMRRGGTQISLLSDRSEDREAELVFEARCDVAGASPVPPRAEGVRSSLLLDAVSPLYAGTRYDVFPGGCVRSTFSFPRGPHIPLMEELTASVDLVPRRELRVDLREELGVELDP